MTVWLWLWINYGQGKGVGGARAEIHCLPHLLIFSLKIIYRSLNWLFLVETGSRGHFRKCCLTGKEIFLKNFLWGKGLQPVVLRYYSWPCAQEWPLTVLHRTICARWGLSQAHDCHRQSKYLSLWAILLSFDSWGAKSFALHVAMVTVTLVQTSGSHADPWAQNGSISDYCLI